MTNLQLFKDICISNKMNEVLNTNRWTEVKNEQEKYGNTYKPKRTILVHFGLVTPTCPNCGNLLTKESISHKDGYEKSILSCKCEYKYAEEWRY